MSLFQKKVEKPNYWKIVGITLGIIAGIAAVGAIIYALYAKCRKNNEICDCCDCDDYCLDDDFGDEIEIEELDEIADAE